MDPETTWQELLDAADAGDWPTAGDRAQALKAWLDRGGFSPQVTKRAELSALDNVLVRAACRFVVHHAQKAR